MDATPSSLQQPDPGPMVRFEELKKDVAFPSQVFQRLTAEEPETLRQIAKSLRVPKGAFVQWFVTEHGELWEAAKLVLAHDRHEEMIRIADDKEGDVGRDKLRVAARQWSAARMDRREFGERSDVKVEVDDKRPVMDREQYLLEVARSVAWLLANGGEVEARRLMAALPAPEKEKIIGDGKGAEMALDASASSDEII